MIQIAHDDGIVGLIEDRGLLPEPLLGQFLVGHVDVDAKQAHQAVLVVVGGDRPAVNPAVAAVFVPQTIENVDGGLLALLELFDDLFNKTAIIRMNGVPPFGLVGEDFLVLRVTEHAFIFGRGVELTGGGVPVPESEIGGAECEIETSLLFLQFLHDAPSLDGVADGAVQHGRTEGVFFEVISRAGRHGLDVEWFVAGVGDEDHRPGGRTVGAHPPDQIDAVVRSRVAGDEVGVVPVLIDKPPAFVGGPRPVDFIPDRFYPGQERAEVGVRRGIVVDLQDLQCLEAHGDAVPAGGGGLEAEGIW